MFDTEIDVNCIIEKLLSIKELEPNSMIDLKEEDILYIIMKSEEVFRSEDSLLEIEAPLKICGDIHGQFPDLIRIFETCGYPGQEKYLFLGDYVDRGKQSIETICLLLCYKIRFPNRIFLLRGNHESANLNRIYGFYDECKRRYSVRLWKSFTSLFNLMSPAGLIEDKVLCMHGGLSPELDEINEIKRIIRPTEIPDSGVYCDLLWADPLKGKVKWGKNDRGISFTFNEIVVEEFVERNNLELIVRAHQVIDEGFEFFAKRKLVTVFSAPNYCGEFDNKAAVLIIDEILNCSIKVIQSREERNRPKEGTNV